MKMSTSAVSVLIAGLAAGCGGGSFDARGSLDVNMDPLRVEVTGLDNMNLNATAQASGGGGTGPLITVNPPAINNTNYSNTHVGIGIGVEANSGAGATSESASNTVQQISQASTSDQDPELACPATYRSGSHSKANDYERPDERCGLHYRLYGLGIPEALVIRAE
jgi:hypothetical protein